MTGKINVTIDPKVTNGTQLAANISDWRQAVLSMHKGTARPAYAVAGTLWINTASSPWKLHVFDGARDVLLGQIDPKAHHFAGADANTPRSISTGGTGASTVGDARHNLGLGEGDSPTFVGVNATGNVTVTGDASVRSLTSAGGLYVNGGHVGDGDNDYGLIISAYEPAISLLDRSDNAGSAQIRAQSDGSIWFLRDTRNDGTIGHDSSKTTKIVVKFSPDGPIFYNADGDQIAHIKTDGEVWTKKYGSLDTRFAARNTEAYAVGSYTIAILNQNSTIKSTYINNSLVSGSKFSDDVIMFDIGSDCYAGKISTSSYSASFQREMGITPGTIPGTWRIMTPLYAFHDGTDVEGWTTINLIMRVA